MRRLLSTNNDLAITFARLALGIMILAHGSQKMLGLFGGQGFSSTMEAMTQKMGIPSFLAFLAIVAEFFGGLGLITGTLSRLAALGVGTVMAVAMLKFHLAHGFFMNWFGNQKGEGIEFFILALGLAAAVLIRGGGAFSVDVLITKWLEARNRTLGSKAAIEVDASRVGATTRG